MVEANGIDLGLQPRLKEIEVKILLKYFRVGFKIVSKWEIKI